MSALRAGLFPPSDGALVDSEFLCDFVVAQASDGTVVPVHAAKAKALDPYRDDVVSHGDYP